MKAYTYLLVDFFSILIPFLFSFDKRLGFYKKWKSVLPAILLTGLLFIPWDIAFTRREVWGFNPDYLTGASLLGLPMEEWLFFFCIPYACLFTYDAFKILQPFDFLKNHRNLIGWGLFLFSLCAGLYSYPKLYSTSAFLLLCAFIFLLQTVWKNTQLSRFYWTYALLLVPFFAVNGILTGTLLDEPVVWYNNSENLGFRLGTIPFEDAFYGMLLLFMNFAWFDFFEKRKVKQNVPTRRKERIPVS